MGTWGYGLYSDDVTRDVKDIYVDKLRRGKSGMQASKEMIAEFKWALDDEDDAPLFWFAMADTQWNYGRLQNEVKTQALYYLNDIKNLQRWEFENPKMFSKRKEVLNSLCKKIMTQQPPEKKSFFVSFTLLSMENRRYIFISVRWRKCEKTWY